MWPQCKTPNWYLNTIESKSPVETWHTWSQITLESWSQWRIWNFGNIYNVRLESSANVIVQVLGFALFVPLCVFTPSFCIKPSVQQGRFILHLTLHIRFRAFAFKGKREPTGTKKTPKVNQMAIKMHPKIRTEKRQAGEDVKWRFLTQLGRFGCHFVANWILKGSPNRPFLYKINIKS